MEPRLLLDTCIVSYWFKQHPLAELYRPLLEDRLLGLSFITLGELYRWPLIKGWGPQRHQEYEEALKTYVVLWCDEMTCRWWAKVSTIKGHPMPVNDSWIAATALRYETPLVTHNVKDFAHLQPLGLKLITAAVA
jgi:predicted nucleic acid-binding protein